MEKLVSNWSNVRSVPEDYIFPPETRPGDLLVPVGEGIPVIDLSEAQEGDRSLTVQKILKAAQEFGFFQVINHGVSENLMNETMSVFKELFHMPSEAKQKLCSEDVTKNCVFYTGGMNYATEKVHFWRDFLKHPCHPLEKWQHVWPENPARYRECVGACSVEVKKLASRILKLISEGLGLNCDYLEDELLSGSMELIANHYPPCPEPSLTLGAPKHADVSLITILLQDQIQGLQVFKDDTWIGVQPVPHAFVVNIGWIMGVISNNKLKIGEHRVVTNLSNARTTAVFFINALDDSVIEPSKTLIDDLHPPIFKSFKTRDFIIHFVAENADSEAALKFLRRNTSN